MTEMHDVVEMLLNRMKDYPEDFVLEPNSYQIHQTKWQKALSMVQGVAAPHEKEALDIRLQEAQRVIYMGAALKTMMSDEVEEKEDDKPYMTMKSSNRYAFGISTPTEGVTSMMTQLETKQKAMEAQMQRQYAANAYGNLLSTGSALG